jgi:hypothetical protein
MWQQLNGNPAALSQLGAGLPPVAAEPGPLPSPPVAGPSPSPFSPEQAPIGAWSNLLNTQSGGPYNLSNPVLMTDGTVLVHRTDNPSWYRLTPDINGSYINGTWSQIASLPIIGGTQYDPKFFASAVLPDGRLIVEGGEYNNGASAWTNLGAIYDLATNTWTPVSPPAGWTQIGDAQSTVLADGTYMLASCCNSPPVAALFNPTNLTWIPTGSGKYDIYDEEAWALLPTGQLLTVDAYVSTGTCGTGTEIYNPVTRTWTSAGNVPAQLSDCNTVNGNQASYEIGPNVLTYYGTVLAFGGTASTTVPSALAIYTITSSQGGVWSAGANQPSLCGAGANLPCTMADAPAAALPNGNVLIAASAGLFANPTYYFEYFPPSNTYAAAPPTSDAGSSTSFYHNFLVLPTGQVLQVSTYNSTIQIYTPSGTYAPTWQPQVVSVSNCLTPGVSYKLSGLQLSGLTQGAYYGDDQQANTNFPVVRIVNNNTHHVFYGRTYGWTASVAPLAAGITEFDVASTTETGASTLYVVANGIPSTGTPVTVGSCGRAIADSHDYNTDGKSDIIWRDSSGNVAYWLMNGSSVIGANYIASVGTNWSMVGQRDFNGDGYTDILWRDNLGNTVIWLMNGVSYASGWSLGNIPTSWSVVATGDFNGDGNGDIMWRDSITGDCVVWLMSGGTIIGSGYIGAPSVSVWTVVGAGDFNGDGYSDILWRDTSGNVAMWFMQGTTVLSSQIVGNVSTVWSIRATGDFNGDGKADILWSEPGQWSVWLMDGTTLLASGAGAVGSVWNIVETGDYNGDGKSDILWVDNVGNYVMFLMNGTIPVSEPFVGTALLTQWTVQSVNAD